MNFIRPLVLGALLAAGAAGFLSATTTASFASERFRSGIERSHVERGEHHGTRRSRAGRSERRHFERGHRSGHRNRAM